MGLVYWKHTPVSRWCCGFSFCVEEIMTEIVTSNDFHTQSSTQYYLTHRVWIVSQVFKMQTLIQILIYWIREECSCLKWFTDLNTDTVYVKEVNLIHDSNNSQTSQDYFLTQRIHWFKWWSSVWERNESGSWLKWFTDLSTDPLNEIEVNLTHGSKDSLIQTLICWMRKKLILIRFEH